MRKRRIVRTDGRLAGWQYCLIVMIVLVGFFLIWIILTPLTLQLMASKYVNEITGMLTIINAVSVIIALFSYYTRPLAPNFKIKKMRFGQKRIVSAILRRFTDTLIIYNL